MTTLITPAGMPASWASLAISSGVSGASSAGLSTTVLPMAMAGPVSWAVSGPGAFHGMMLAHTP